MLDQMDRRTKGTLTTIALIALIAASVLLFNHLANGYATAATTTPRLNLQGEKVYDTPIPAPGFTLKDQNGQTISLSQFKGRPVFLIFLDSQCPHGDCELEEQQIGQAAKDLGPQASQVAWVGITVNVTDTPQTVNKSLQNNNVNIAAFHWLLGTQQQLSPVWNAYAEYVQTDPSTGVVIHSDQSFILDKQGKERVQWFDDYLDHSVIAADLKTLLAA
jgi:protein SCO1